MWPHGILVFCYLMILKKQFWHKGREGNPYLLSCSSSSSWLVPLFGERADTNQRISSNIKKASLCRFSCNFKLFPVITVDFFVNKTCFLMGSKILVFPMKKQKDPCSPKKTWYKQGKRTRVRIRRIWELEGACMSQKIIRNF